ncbi:MAG: tRNA pseudouridine(55) synthase TruB [Pirellulales bacterium]|nr:tRNA pseudouridine(55) synthase TruB [Pirellulales bacterium]
MPYLGLINLNKPSGITSRRAVDLVGRVAGKTKIGHAGTLDPLADGVLVLCLGSATRLIEYVQQMPKQYSGTFLLGRRSDTEDTYGNVVELSSPPIPTLEEIKTAAGGLCGLIQQCPPVFSAIKIKGQRAYHLARAGKSPDLKARPVRVYRIDVVSYEYPVLKLDIECGSGTYIRSIGRDLAESLGTAAVMSALTRTAIGRFILEDSIDLNDLEQQDLSRCLLPPVTGVEMLPKVKLEPQDVIEVGHGRTIPMPINASVLCKSQTTKRLEFAGIAPDGRLVAILIPQDQHRLRPLRNFPVN